MTSANDLHLSDFIFPEFQLFSHNIEAKYLCNHAKHFKGLLPHYTLLFFTVDKAKKIVLGGFL